MQVVSLQSNTEKPNSVKLKIKEVNTGVWDTAIHHDAENCYWSRSHRTPHTRAQASPNVTIEFCGKTYDGKYRYSIVDGYCNFQSDYYGYDGGFFAIHENSGEVITFAVMNPETGSFPFDQCKEQAIELASQWINPSDYKLSYSTDEFIHSFLFEKYYGDLNSCAVLSLGYNTKGDLVTFQRFMTEEMNAAEQTLGMDQMMRIAALFSSKETEEEIHDYIENVYHIERDYQLYGDIEYEKTLVLLPEGDPALICKLEYEIATRDADNPNIMYTSSEIFTILVTLQ